MVGFRILTNAKQKDGRHHEKLTNNNSAEQKERQKSYTLLRSYTPII